MALRVTVESSTSVSVKEFDGGVKYEYHLHGQISRKY